MISGHLHQFGLAILSGYWEEVEGDFPAKVTPTLTPVLCGSGVLCPWQGSHGHTSFPTSITNSEVLMQGSLWPRSNHGPKLVTNSQVFILIWNGIGAFSPIISFLFFPSLQCGVWSQTHRFFLGVGVHPTCAGPHRLPLELT